MQGFSNHQCGHTRHALYVFSSEADRHLSSHGVGILVLSLRLLPLLSLLVRAFLAFGIFQFRATPSFLVTAGFLSLYFYHFHSPFSELNSFLLRNSKRVMWSFFCLWSFHGYDQCLLMVYPLLETVTRIFPYFCSTLFKRSRC